MNVSYDVAIVGAGPSGSFYAMALQEAGLRCLLLEAGPWLQTHEYPETERDGTTKLFWGGGVELDADVTLGLLRARVVGGGSVINQALLDRFDEEAWSGFREASGIADFSSAHIDPFYERIEKSIPMVKIPESGWNGNARIFADGLKKLGYRTAPLRRGQLDCRWSGGNDCIACLNGCRAGSKQSALETALPRALAAGLVLKAGVIVDSFQENADSVDLRATDGTGTQQTFRAKRLVLAAGPLGNIPILARSGFGKLPALGQGFVCHPQVMMFARYGRDLEPHRGPFQALKSDEPKFRAAGYKLENVFAPLGAMALLLPVSARQLLTTMRDWRRFACIEVAIRDATPGRIRFDPMGRVSVRRPMRSADRARRDAGIRTIREVFAATDAEEVMEGTTAIGLHLLGGCAMSSDDRTGVVDPDGRLYASKRVHLGDGSVFPNAPGLNPSLTIMSLSLRNAERMLADARRD